MVRCRIALVVAWTLCLATANLMTTARAEDGIKRYEKLREWQAGIGIVSAIAWSPDGERVAAVSLQGKLAIWNTPDSKLLHTMQVYSGALQDLDWDSSGFRIATAGEDGTVRIWDPLAGRENCVLVGHGRSLFPGEGTPAGVAVVKWSPDGNNLASGGYDGELRVWEINAPCPNVESIVFPLIHPWGVHDLDWSPDSKQLISTGVLNMIPFWDVATGEMQSAFRCPLPESLYECRFLTVDWSADGQHIVAYGDKGERPLHELWNVATRRSRPISPQCDGSWPPYMRYGYAERWMPHTEALIGWCGGGQQLQIWDAQTLDALGILYLPDRVQKGIVGVIDFAVAADEQRILLSYNTETGGILQLWGVVN